MCLFVALSSPAGSKHVQTKFESKDKKKHEPGKLVKGRNEPCTIVQVQTAVISARARLGCGAEKRASNCCCGEQHSGTHAGTLFPLACTRCCCRFWR